MQGTIAVFIPIVVTLVIGIVVVTGIYFHSKEKQMMIEKGISYEQMVEFLKTKRNPYTWLKFGIVVMFFGIGLGLGLLIRNYSDVEEWVPFMLITFTGLGFVLAYLAERKLEKNKQ
jgi:hypothetical protein